MTLSDELNGFRLQRIEADYGVTLTEAERAALIEAYRQYEVVFTQARQMMESAQTLMDKGEAAYQKAVGGVVRNAAGKGEGHE